MTRSECRQREGDVDENVDGGGEMYVEGAMVMVVVVVVADQMFG